MAYLSVKGLQSRATWSLFEQVWYQIGANNISYMPIIKKHYKVIRSQVIVPLTCADYLFVRCLFELYWIERDNASLTIQPPVKWKYNSTIVVLFHVIAINRTRDIYVESTWQSRETFISIHPRAEFTGALYKK